MLEEYWPLLIFLIPPVLLFLYSLISPWNDARAQRKIIEEKTRANVQQLLNSTRQDNPWLAESLSDLEYEADLHIADRLRYKRRPALKASAEIKRIAAEKRALNIENRKLKYQLGFLETVYPWLPSFEELPPSSALYETGAVDENYDGIRNWISPEEYNKLSTAERNQLALDRWKQRKKEPWEAGRDYERFVGYLYEQAGFSVEYEGALKGKEDRGIDLIAKQGSHVEIIQCKRYSAKQSKFVRENTVAQTYGVTALYQMEHPKADVSAVIITSSELSEEAKHFAEYLGITVKDNLQLNDYPMIKCNVNKQNERIYHLPFDQSYDRTKISGKKGSLYVATVKEAEDLGFRRAKKWTPDTTAAT